MRLFSVACEGRSRKRTSPPTGSILPPSTDEERPLRRQRDPRRSPRSSPPFGSKRRCVGRGGNRRCGRVHRCSCRHHHPLPRTKGTRRGPTRRILGGILSVFGVAAVDAAVVHEALQLPCPDFEDAVTAAAARNATCDLIVTRVRRVSADLLSDPLRRKPPSRSSSSRSAAPYLKITDPNSPKNSRQMNQ